MNRPVTLRKCLGSLAAQTVVPGEVVVVHAGTDEQLGAELQREYAAAPFALKYVRTQPSLVRQRMLGIANGTGEVVFFLDDDVVLEPAYCERILAVYAADAAGEIGGVQGSITYVPPLVRGSPLLRRVFMLARMGKRGYLQRSGFPCHSLSVSKRTDVEVFSGCMMSYRRRVLEIHQFDMALRDRWWGDDWDLSYRVSRAARLVQLPDARLAHEQAEAGRDSVRRTWRMMVVNHHYLYRKLLRSAGQGWLPWAWAEAGLWLLALMRFLTGRGTAALEGMAGGFGDLYRGVGRQDAPLS